MRCLLAQLWPTSHQHIIICLLFYCFTHSYFYFNYACGKNFLTGSGNTKSMLRQLMWIHSCKMYINRYQALAVCCDDAVSVCQLTLHLAELWCATRVTWCPSSPPPWPPPSIPSHTPTSSSTTRSYRYLLIKGIRLIHSLASIYPKTNNEFQL